MPLRRTSKPAATKQLALASTQRAHSKRPSSEQAPGTRRAHAVGVSVRPAALVVFAAVASVGVPVDADAGVE